MDTSGGEGCTPVDIVAGNRMQMKQQQQAPMQNAWCSGCGGAITERFLLQAVDRCWHTRCLKCHHCSIPLSDLGSSCYSRGGMILCRNDYLRLFGSNGTCSGCSMHIPATEFVLRAASNVYHVQCFVCSQCRCPLQTGDRYALLNGQPVCEADFAKAFGAAAAVAAAAAATTAAATAAPPPTTTKRGGGGGKKKGGGGGGNKQQQQQQQVAAGTQQQQQQQPPLQSVC